MPLKQSLADQGLQKGTLLLFKQKSRNQETKKQKCKKKNGSFFKEYTCVSLGSLCLAMQNILISIMNCIIWRYCYIKHNYLKVLQTYFDTFSSGLRGQLWGRFGLGWYHRSRGHWNIPHIHRNLSRNQINLLHIYTFEYMNIENISTNGHAFMCTNISTYGFSQLERKLKKFY